MVAEEDTLVTTAAATNQGWGLLSLTTVVAVTSKLLVVGDGGDGWKREA